MSLHYTSTRRPFPWRPFVFNVIVPFLLILNVTGYWVRGEAAPVWAAFVTVFYVVYRIGRFVAKKTAPEQIYLYTASIAFAVLSVYSLTRDGSEWVLITATSEAFTFIFFLAGIVKGHDARLHRLEAPVAKDRAHEFPGIYCITCRPNGKQYIGQTSRPIRERWRQHCSDLQGQRHPNKWLQADWNLYRTEQFDFSVLEIVNDPAWLFDRERYWQDKDYDASRRYNPPNIPAHPRSAVQRRKPVRRSK